MIRVLKWALVYGRLEVEEFDNLDTALLSACERSDTGAESLECIEVFNGFDRRFLAPRDVWERGYRLQAEMQALVPAPPPVEAVLEIRLGSTWAVLDSFETLHEAHVCAGEWVERVGEARVRVRRVP